MLFIISTNQKKDEEMSLSGTLETSSGDTMNAEDSNPELEKLVEKITEDETTIPEDEEVDSEDEKMEDDTQEEAVEGS